MAATGDIERLGPCYDTTGLSEWLGITEQAVHQRVESHRLLALDTGSGQTVYPVWQFIPCGAPLTGLPAVLTVLLSATDPWTASVWLNTPMDRLNGASVIEVLRRSQGSPGDTAPLDAILTAAREDAAKWSQ